MGPGTRAESAAKSNAIQTWLSTDCSARALKCFHSALPRTALFSSCHGNLTSETGEQLTSEAAIENMDLYKDLVATIKLCTLLHFV